jgi:hypothetical protein
METLLSYVRLIVNPNDDAAALLAISELKYARKSFTRPLGIVDSHFPASG